MKTKNIFLKFVMAASVLLLTPATTHPFGNDYVSTIITAYTGALVALTTVANTFIGSSAYWLYSGKTSKPALALAAVSGSIIAYTTYKMTRAKNNE